MWTHYELNNSKLKLMNWKMTYKIKPCNTDVLYFYIFIQRKYNI